MLHCPAYTRISGVNISTDHFRNTDTRQAKYCAILEREARLAQLHTASYGASASAMTSSRKCLLRNPGVFRSTLRLRISELPLHSKEQQLHPRPRSNSTSTSTPLSGVKSSRGTDPNNASRRIRLPRQKQQLFLRFSKTRKLNFRKLLKKGRFHLR